MVVCVNVNIYVYICSEQSIYVREEFCVACCAYQYHLPYHQQ